MTANAQTIVDTLPHNRNVIIEQFNGCGYCPDAHRVSDAICNQYPDRVFDIRIFQGTFARYNLPQYITHWGDALAQNGLYFLNSYPSGDINRHKFSQGNSDDGYYLNRNRWSSCADSIMQMPSPVNIAATVSFNDTTRVMTVNVELYYTSNSSQSTNNLNVVLLQNNIIDSNISFQQWYPEMEVEDTLYRYMHVLRDMLTGQWGVEINTTTAGSYVSWTYTYIVPDSINGVPVSNLCDLEVVAFVSEGHMEILNACRATSNVVDSILNNLIVDVNIPEAGMIRKTQCVFTGEATVWALPVYGYSFIMWNDSVTDNPRTIIPGVDTVLTAFFDIRQFPVEVSSADTLLGSVTGGGIYNYMDTVIITANPVSDHHHFVRWSDGDTTNPRTIIVDRGKFLTAYFAINKYTIIVSSNNMLYGATEGGGERNYGQPITLTAVAYSGYRFVRWSNGVTYNPYTFAVTQDSILTAIFLPEDSIFTIVATADPTTGSVQGGGEYGFGDTIVIKAMPNLGYRFERWHDDDTNNPRTIVVTTNATYIAYFKRNASNSIESVESIPVKIYLCKRNIVLEGAKEMPVMLYDATGRLLATRRSEETLGSTPVQFNVPVSGTYLVRVGNLPAKKVVVIR